MGQSAAARVEVRAVAASRVRDRRTGENGDPARTGGELGLKLRATWRVNEEREFDLFIGGEG
jgi:hypothetical protein